MRTRLTDTDKLPSNTEAKKTKALSTVMDGISKPTIVNTISLDSTFYLKYSGVRPTIKPMMNHSDEYIQQHTIEACASTNRKRFRSNIILQRSAPNHRYQLRIMPRVNCTQEAKSSNSSKQGRRTNAKRISLPSIAVALTQIISTKILLPLLSAQ